MAKIELGFHRLTGKMITYLHAARGEKCNCECPECGEPLSAAHGEILQYFKHVNDKSKCLGRPEKLGSRLAKEILQHATSVNISTMEDFSYDQCEIEVWRYGKRPDAYLIDSATSRALIVEIWDTNKKTAEILQCFNNHQEDVLEIRISEYVFDQNFSYKGFRAFVLFTAPRKWYGYSIVTEKQPAELQAASSQQEEGIWKYIIGLALMVIAIIWLKPFRR